MKKIIQAVLFLIFVLIILVFYNKYFTSEKNTKIESSTQSKLNKTDDNKSNLIKNLTYELNLQNNNKYNIVAEESELFYSEGTELVKMKNVTAKFIDDKNNELVIISDNALFNSTTYNTSFDQNVVVKYIDSTILSENLDLDFIKNIVIIYNNVVYEGLQGLMKTDNIKINLITKNAEIFMNDLSKKILGVVVN